MQGLFFCFLKNGGIFKSVKVNLILNRSLLVNNNTAEKLPVNANSLLTMQSKIMF